MGLILGLGRSPGGRNGNPLQYSCPGNPMDRGRSLVGYSSRGREELDMTEELNTHTEHKDAHRLIPRTNMEKGICR